MVYDYLLVGGGLQNGLLALALRHHRPRAAIAIIERDSALGGNHTWSHHAGDVPDAAGPWFDPLVQWRWSGYDVVFPSCRRTVNDAYASFTGTHLDAVVQAALSDAPRCKIFLGAEATRVEATAVELRDGLRIEARTVIDARGPQRSCIPERTGYQKFLGLEVRLREPHQLVRPLLMDATVPQVDGLHFIYALPFAPDRLLIEDTYFSDDARLDPGALHARIRSWASERGMSIVEVLREEKGVLPMPCVAVPASTAAPLRAGYAGGWFNHATGYSLPVAVRLAQAVAEPGLPTERETALAKLARERDRQTSFLVFLNQLMFEATAPSSRRYVLERFHRLPAGCIARLYALQLRRMDQLRILVGRPPREASPARVIEVARQGLWPAIAPSWARYVQDLNMEWSK
ncbi:lycopene beta-cyclase CrtY [Sorangium sp. So ce269]